jgi:uncharacterized cupin superfamily protein
MHSTPYLVRTSELDKGEGGAHPLDPNVLKYKQNLGDKVGLTQAGVHLITVPPGNISTVPHWHSNEDEWFYIIRAGEDARIVLYEDGAAEPGEGQVKTGDFFGFPAATRTGHVFKSGSDELVYIVGGSRKEVDVVHYPAIKMKAIIDRTGPDLYWGVKEESMITPKNLPSKK